MTTTSGIEERLAHFRERSQAFSWHAGVISEIEELTMDGRTFLQMVVTVAAADSGGKLATQSFQHVPPRPILDGTVRYYRLGHFSELVGRAVWLLVRYGRAYKVFGARELEDSHTTDG